MPKTTTGDGGAAAQGTEWLTALEERVRAASERLRELRDENAALRQRIGELEMQLDDASSGDGAGGRWLEERQEIRGRVERLVQHLEEIVGE